MRISCELLGFHFNLYFGKQPEEEQPEESVSSDPQIFDSGVTSSMPMHVDPAQDPRNFGFFYQEPFVPKSPVQNPSMKPSVGRIVHYQSFGSAGGRYSSVCRAAIVTAVHDNDPVPQSGMPYVDLAVLNPTGFFFDQNCPYSEDPNGGSWHWPERVEG